jgi:glycosyltransferase involved in cell wall biosynthesis
VAADVTICIPAWQAEPFIARTLDCARAQTHRDVRILVSIDRSDDATEAICRAAAQGDARIDVVAQPERLGWSANANWLLRAVDTPWFFLYFHDDEIAPVYVERLLAALRARPDATSAHCDLEKYGRQSLVERGTAYDGRAAERLVAYLAEETKGPLLRGLLRSELAKGGLCFPEIAGSGNWRVPPFAMRVLAEGPSVYVPEILYRRWMREGSLTATWNPATAEELLEGQRRCIELCLAEIDAADATPAERAVARFALAVRMLIRTRTSERLLPLEALIDRAAIAPLCADLQPPGDLWMLEPALAAAVRSAWERLLELELQIAKRRTRDARARRRG